MLNGRKKIRLYFEIFIESSVESGWEGLEIFWVDIVILKSRY